MNPTQQIAKHFEYAGCREFRQSEDHFDAIEAMEEHLLAGEYNPHHFDNLLEAMSNTKNLQPAALSAALKDNDLLLAGEILRHITETYWTERAAEDAPAALEKYRAKQAEEFANCRRYG